MLQKLEAEFDWMQNLDVLDKIEPTDRINSLGIVKETNGQI